MERINVRVDKRLKEELEAEAREKGVQPSVIVRQAREESMRSRTPHSNCRDLAERLGLISASGSSETAHSSSSRTSNARPSTIGGKDRRKDTHCSASRFPVGGARARP
jgi:hypothetical protein